MTPSKIFDYDQWNRRLGSLKKEYARGEPYPHVLFSGLLEPAAVREVVREFPGPTDIEWIQYKHFNENKLGKSKRDEFPPFIGRVVDELNSPRFLGFLEKLTGIPGLLADPRLDGGGMHQSGRGGFLNIHADFTRNHYQPWRRRLNLILYLNEGWKESWGGSLELWDKDMKRCVKKVAPRMNHAILFNTDEDSYHGFPERLLCPEGVSRKSLALYYYTPMLDSDAKPRSTNYRARPADGWKAPLIWLDKKAVYLYSALKSRFKLSDDWTKIIRFWGGS